MRLPVSISAAFCVASATAFPQHGPIENGLPCVEEVCVDDDLVSVLDLPWRAVPPSRSASSADVRDEFRADEEVLQRVAAYWPSHVFDAEGLRALSQVRAVCRQLSVGERPSGVFSTADGQDTTVIFEPEPRADGRGVVFRVAAIIRRPAPGASAGDIERFAREAQRRYAGLSLYASTNSPGAQWRTTPSEGPALRLVAAVGDPQQRALDLAMQAPCLSD